MATVFICVYVGQAQLQLFALAPFTARLVSRTAQQAIGSLLRWLPACPVCLWGGTEWVGQSKDSPCLSPTQCPLPQWDSQTWTGQGVMGSRISHRWLTATAGALGSFSGSHTGPRTASLTGGWIPFFKLTVCLSKDKEVVFTFFLLATHIFKCWFRSALFRVWILFFCKVG